MTSTGVAQENDAQQMCLAIENSSWLEKKKYSWSFRSLRQDIQIKWSFSYQKLLGVGSQREGNWNAEAYEVLRDTADEFLKMETKSTQEGFRTKLLSQTQI